MKKQKLNMKLVIGTAAILVVLFSATVSANENGEISQFSYSPKEPVVLEDMTFSTDVRNTGDGVQSYLLQLQITKDGKIVHDEDFTFSLEKDKGINFKSQYVPSDIDEHQIIVKLYDKNKIDLLDTKLSRFNAVSNIGPFDIVIDPLTSRIRPGFLLPVNVFLENKGIKGTDVTAVLKIKCHDSDLTQSLTVFLPPENKIEKLVSMQVCEQEGLYEVSGSLILFNKTWISSTNQFFVNPSKVQLQFEVQDKIVLKPGENLTLPIEVTNIGDVKVTDLSFVVQKIPIEWQKATPSSIDVLGPHEKALFLVTVTIPEDAEPNTYEIRMDAASNEVLDRKIVELEISPLATLPIVSGLPILKYVIISALSFVGVGAFGFEIVRHIKRKSSSTFARIQRAATLRKLKEKVSPSR